MPQPIRRTKPFRENILYATHTSTPATPIKYMLRRLVLEEAGQDLIEYALIAGLLGLGAIASLRGLSTAISAALSRVGSVLVSST